MNTKFSAAFLRLRLFIYISASSATFQYRALTERNEAHFNEGCYNHRGVGHCFDIRICKHAAASIAIGGWPPICGWVDGVVPKVCCQEPLVFGGALMRKVEEERKTQTECGVERWYPNLSETEREFYNVLKDLPDIKYDPSRFDPPVDVPDVSGVPSAPYVGGGVPTLQGQFQWVVSITQNGRQLCGGSLIDFTHVLSAAHCFVKRGKILNPVHLQVLIGNVTVNAGYPYNVKKLRVHEMYVEDQHYNDIALLTLDREVESYFNPICLPSRELSIRNLAGANTSTLGWGRTSFGGKSSSKLMIARNLPVVETEQCRRVFSEIGSRSLSMGITNEFICAGLEEGGKDACKGDSGGPLMLDIEQYYSPNSIRLPRWVLVGIVSFGYKCGEPGIPGVYTRVSNYMPWIFRNMKE